MPTTGSPLTSFSIPGRWGGSRGRSSSRVNGVRRFDSSSRRETGRRLQPGSRTSSGFFTSSTCVRSVLLNIQELSSTRSDRAGNRYKRRGCGNPRCGRRYPYNGYGHPRCGRRYPYSGCGHPHDGRGYPSKRVDGTGRYFQQKPPGRCDLLSTKYRMLIVT